MTKKNIFVKTNAQISIEYLILIAVSLGSILILTQAMDKINEVFIFLIELKEAERIMNSIESRINLLNELADNSCMCEDLYFGNAHKELKKDYDKITLTIRYKTREKDISRDVKLRNVVIKNQIVEKLKKICITKKDNFLIIDNKCQPF
ncbi:MAG: hypothetical protein N3D73_01530 [Candidatus Diapherotrites archaeon]|nr:hypothetical protein [Candidatus Diapherotrites archaeon]